MTVKFTIVGKITGKERPRMTKSGHTYTPSKTRSYEELVQVAYKQQCSGIFFGLIPNSKLCYPIEVRITARYPIPLSYTAGKKAVAKHNIIRPTKKPDADNIAKIICDALNGVAYIDDKQIVKLIVDKSYTTLDERVDVWISEVKHGDEQTSKAAEGVPPRGQENTEGRGDRGQPQTRGSTSDGGRD